MAILTEAYLGEDLTNALAKNKGKASLKKVENHR